jgi:peptide methionine sulfoxide reductase msrA/msrB
MKNIVIIVFFALLSSCSQSQESKSDKTSEEKSTSGYKIQKTDAEWKEQLTSKEYNVLIEKGTERAFTGDLLENKKAGEYTCKGCGNPLFSDESKFKSGTGWPSFDAVINSSAIAEHLDNSYGTTRGEIVCNSCGGHLGHVFNDGPTSTGLRYCVNSCSLNFIEENNEKSIKAAVLDTLTLGGGCFWCVEAIYELLDGVVAVESGYSGGTKDNATYKKVGAGITEHAEVVQVVFDTNKVSLFEILEVFFSSHDPTTLDRQGADRGPQYRSVIFYRNASQRTVSNKVVEALEDYKIYSDPVVTKVDAFKGFYSAEQYHQDYYKDNADQYYCKAVITPKVEKFKKIFKDKLKK